MKSYATAMEADRPKNVPSFGGNWVPGARTKHGVVWPDPRGQEWDSVKTLCGKSTREYSMWQVAQGNSPVWPGVADGDKYICPNCQREGDQSA
ncbi:hypothetical protein [Nocardia tengchongensis]|uniref:hypothetical protein n=1 Tax=Nocardia tengchongensis TaxID=2055889 RepID=UPI0036A25FDD